MQLIDDSLIQTIYQVLVKCKKNLFPRADPSLAKLFQWALFHKEFNNCPVSEGEQTPFTKNT